MLDRYNRRVRNKSDKERRSKLEDEVEQALINQGYSPEYESERFSYVLHRKYRPDFKVGNVYVEVKGWWPPAERSKFLAVILNNPGLPIFVALQRPTLTLSKQSKTTYAQWCSKHGIAWSPIPIPPDFMKQWQEGARPTFHVPTKSAAAQTQQPNTQTVLFTASPANSDSPLMDNPGRSQ